VPPVSILRPGRISANDVILSEAGRVSAACAVEGPAFPLN
jgi:hypothetical protein